MPVERVSSRLWMVTVEDGGHAATSNTNLRRNIIAYVRLENEQLQVYLYRITAYSRSHGTPRHIQEHIPQNLTPAIKAVIRQAVVDEMAQLLFHADLKLWADITGPTLLAPSGDDDSKVLEDPVLRSKFQALLTDTGEESEDV